MLSRTNTNTAAILIALSILILWCATPIHAQHAEAASPALDPLRLNENLIENGNFAQLDDDAAPVAWTAVDAVGARDTARRRGGEPSGRLTRRERGEGYWRQDVLSDLEPGARYILSAWVLGEPGSVAFLGVQALDGTRAGGLQRIYRGLARSEWQPVSMEFTAPASGRVRVWLGADFAGSLWWSGVFLGRSEELPERLARIWEERLQRYGRVFTGLIVDARGLNIARAMSPRLEDADGNLLYAGIGADFDQLIRRGIVSYMKDLNAALNHERLAAHELYPYRRPMVVEGIARVDDGFDGSVIIRSHDAAVIREHLARYDFFSRYAVVFLID